MDKNFKPPKPREMFAQEPLSVRIRNWRPTVMQIAFAISIALHLALLLARFADPQDFNRVFQDTPLEVVLVNARTNEAPTKAQAIAQANLAGGGEADQGIATSPLMASPVSQEGDSEDELEKQINQQMAEQEQLLQKLKAELAAMPTPDPHKGALSAQQVVEEEHHKQMLKDLAAVEKTIKEQNSRPRRRYVSPATREEVYAAWGDLLRQKIEARGTHNYPMMNGKPLRGSLFVNIVVDWRGQVLDAKVMESSGNVALDQRAVAIARQAGPFDPFSQAMRKKADELEWTWHFTFGQEGLSATPYSGRSSS